MVRFYTSIFRIKYWLADKCVITHYYNVIINFINYSSHFPQVFCILLCKLLKYYLLSMLSFVETKGFCCKSTFFASKEFYSNILIMSSIRTNKFSVLDYIVKIKRTSLATHRNIMMKML